MDDGSRGYKWLLWAALLVMVVTAGMSPLAPWGSGIPARDSSAFLYVGKVWAETGQGYSAAWDNKGPALFGLEALAHLVSPRLGFGIWVIELLCYLGSALLMCSAFRRMFGDLSAGWGTLVFSAALSVPLQMGNYTEGFCLPLIAAGVWLVAHKKGGWWVWLLCAVMIVVAALMRVNNAVGLALICFIGPMLVGEEARKVRWGVAGLGVGLGVLFLVAYRGLMGEREFGEMMYAMWGFNQSYAEAGITGKLDAFLKAFLNQTNPVLLIGALAAPFIKSENDVRRRVWVWFAILWIQAAAMGVGGRTYMHYSVVMLPISAVLLGFVLMQLGEKLNRLGWRVGLLLLGVVLPVYLGVAACVKGDRDDAAVRATVSALRGVEGESLYVWGHQASINLLDGRRWRSPMFAESAFRIPNPRREEYRREFVALWRDDPPEVVVFQQDIRKLEELGVDVGRYEVLPERVEGQWSIGVLGD